MSSTEREVAFRKKRRDYAVHKPKNAIQANTTIVRVKQDKFIRPETILARTRQIKADKKKYDVNIKRRESPNFPQPPESLNCALVIRLAGKKENLCAESRKILSGFHLENQFDGCFVFLNEENRKKLKSVSHLISYGSPSAEYVRELIHTQAAVMKDGKEELITSNKTIADALKSHKIICLDDIVEAINKGLSTVEQITDFLAPFHFPKISLAEKPKRPLHAGGNAGWRGDGIIC